MLLWANIAFCPLVRPLLNQGSGQGVHVTSRQLDSWLAPRYDWEH